MEPIRLPSLIPSPEERRASRQSQYSPRKSRNTPRKSLNPSHIVENDEDEGRRSSTASAGRDSIGGRDSIARDSFLKQSKGSKFKKLSPFGGNSQYCLSRLPEVKYNRLETLQRIEKPKKKITETIAVTDEVVSWLKKADEDFARAFGDRMVNSPVELLWILIENKEWDAAVFASTRTVQTLGEKCPYDIFLMVQYIAQEVGDKSKVLPVFAEYRRLFPNTHAAHYELCKQLLLLEEIDAGIEACAEGLRRFPDSEILYSLRGQFEYERGNYKHAVADFHKSIEIARKLEGRPPDLEYSLKTWQRTSIL